MTESKLKSNTRSTGTGSIDVGPIRKILALLSRKERRRLLLLCVGIIILAVTEIAGIGSIGPFLAVATNPALIHSNEYLQWIYVTFGFTTDTGFVVFMGIAVVVLVVLRNVTAAVVRYAEIRFGQMRNHSISTRLLARYLSQPYAFFLNKNTSELSKNVLSEVQEAVKNYLIPMLEVVSKAVVTIAIIVFLVTVDPRVAAFMALALGGVYGGMYIFTRMRLFRVGRLRVEANRRRFQVVSEVLGGIKDAKLMGKESVFLDEYKKPSRRMAKYVTLKTVYGNLPKFVLDSIIFSTIILVVLWFIHDAGDLESAVAIVSVYAVAGYRLMPTLDALYKNIAKIRGSQPAVELIYDELHHNQDAGYLAPRTQPPRITFESEIRMDRVTFQYVGTDEPVIAEQSLTIKKNTTVGFVGPTGCGKTTTVDMLLGLLAPSRGSLIVDRTEITQENLRNWQACLGYVPQHIYLSDDTIARNIAFGVPAKQIDHQQVARAAAIANLDTFIENELPRGYESVVGERGVRLSGGQRQRIGIARAVYHDPEVLVMDEATSALDNVTEAQVMKAIDNLTHQKTIILIAHRISTVRNCDQIFIMDKGRILAQGPYDELLASSPEFRAIVEART